jgi:hypothetical protein
MRANLFKYFHQFHRVQQRYLGRNSSSICVVKGLYYFSVRLELVAAA